MTICKEINCTIGASYNYKGQKRKYCKIHALPDMIIILTDNCKECNIKARFNFTNEIKGLYCSNHALEGMIDVISIKCLEKNCNIQAIYNLPNEKNALYCKKHALSDMINIKDKKCLQEDCNKIPCFNFPNEKTGIFCKKHAFSDMINVKNKKCLQENCNITPCFNYHNEKIGVYCRNHKLPLMLDIYHPMCISCGLFRVTKKGELCKTYCDPNSKLRQKTKEIRVKNIIQKHEITCIHDKNISNDCCLKYRPDFVIDCVDYFIVLEVDEFAHKSYDKDCEIVRMNNISHSLGLPTKFLRYNPDNKEFTEEFKEKFLIIRLKELMLNINNDFTVEYLFYPKVK